MKKITLIVITTFIFSFFVIVVANNITNNNNKIEQMTSIKKNFNNPQVNLKQLSFKTQSNKGNFMGTDQVTQHNSSNDCYLIINNNVYDVTSYLNLHPGGTRIIESNCGKEVTGVFAQIHSNRAWDLLKKYKIANIGKPETSKTPQVLKTLKIALQKANPTAEVIKVRPKANFYVAKVIYQGNLYEIHLDSSGKITKEELENEEPNWNFWDNDKDDN